MKQAKISATLRGINEHVDVSVLFSVFGSEGFQALIAVATVMDEEELEHYAKKISAAISSIHYGGA